MDPRLSSNPFQSPPNNHNNRVNDHNNDLYSQHNLGYNSHGMGTNEALKRNPNSSNGIYDSMPQISARDPKTRPVHLLTSELLATYRLINEVYYKKKQSVDYEVKANEVFSDRYVIVKPLGKGSFGQVVQAFDKVNKEPVAIKIIKNKTPFYNQALIEIKILEHLNSKDPESKYHGVVMKNHFVYQNHLCIVFELLSNNLYDLIRNTHFHGIAIQFVRKFADQLLKALWFLGRPDVGIIHCDLKPENILLREPKRSAIKVIDFGSSCHLNGRMYKYIQSRFYRSPEVLLELDYGHPIDMWSLGCILVEIHTGEPLFPGQTEVDQMTQICSLLGLPPISMIESSPKLKKFFNRIVEPSGNRYELKQPFAAKRSLVDILAIHKAGSGATELLKFKELIESMLIFDPKKRILPLQALQHHFFIPTVEEATSAHGSPSVQHAMALRDAALKYAVAPPSNNEAERRRPNSRVQQSSAPSTIRYYTTPNEKTETSTQTNVGPEPMQM
eukprot:TRINITY_DN1856_c0_g1_i1.p1 TRINITY_DN1856_c0_g1~~TRINITY_DN1856_c0_g1_i1.p1  ORF type:complete len:501 (+),score=135.27 TRINITY_DN1856_c0_g1_i1:328-1830(+)